jgi:hypothetical protein
MDLSSLSDSNSGYNFILLVIDSFSRYTWTRPLKRKTASEVTQAFKSIIEESKREPIQVITDRGKEFFNFQLASYFKSKNINHYAPSNDDFKASLAERSIKSYKHILFKVLTSKLSHRWLEILPEITKSINARHHRTIGMAPKDVNDGNIVQVWRHIQKVHSREKNSSKRERDAIEPGDFVRIAKNKGHVMEKGFLPGWSDEIFKVTRKVERKPKIYNIEDEHGEAIEGAFYKPELQKVSKNSDTLHRINKVLGRRRRRGINQVLVEWVTHNKKKNSSWINESELIENE